jgi:hypothetical protein
MTSPPRRVWPVWPSYCTSRRHVCAKPGESRDIRPSVTRLLRIQPSGLITAEKIISRLSATLVFML